MAEKQRAKLARWKRTRKRFQKAGYGWLELVNHRVPMTITSEPQRFAAVTMDAVVRKDLSVQLGLACDSRILSGI